MSLDLTEDESTLVQLMAWCRRHMESLGHNELIVAQLPNPLKRSVKSKMKMQLEQRR